MKPALTFHKLEKFMFLLLWVVAPILMLATVSESLVVGVDDIGQSEEDTDDGFVFHFSGNSANFMETFNCKKMTNHLGKVINESKLRKAMLATIEDGWDPQRPNKCVITLKISML
uniref:Secreted protein n=1 Tax=Rhabditophanes sp. KR3021 TaxID=114890 RepID=A0AC35TWC8_9BILA